MLRKLKNHSVLFGMIFTVASLLACFIFTWVIYEHDFYCRFFAGLLYLYMGNLRG